MDLLSFLKEVPNTFGFVAAFLTTVAFLPQLIRTFTTKSADDVAFAMLITFLVGLVFWIIYGWQTHSPPVIIANIITFILNFSILVLKFIYQKRELPEQN